MRVDLRAATPDDEAFLTELDAEVNAAEFAGAGLAPAALAQLLAMQYRARTMGYAAQFPHAESYVVWIGPHRIGRVLVNETGQELRLVDIALLEAYRGSGIGTGLLQDLIMRARAEGVPMRLSVRTSNPAARLYERLGFVATASDAVYVQMELGERGRPGSTEPSEGDGPAERVPRGLHSGYFRWLVGKVVNARSVDGTCAQLEVMDVTMMRCLQPSVELNDSFTVSFTGPQTPFLPSAMCELREADGEPEAGGEPLLVFLVPLGPKGNLMQYEAVFNRSQWKRSEASYTQV